MRDRNGSHRRGQNRAGGSSLSLVVVSLLVLVVLIVALIGKDSWFRKPLNRETLIVYCAAGVMPAVKAVAEQYEAEEGFGAQIEFRSGNSGQLEVQIRSIRNQKGGDLYIPAASDPYLERNRVGQEDGFVEEILPLAQFRLVLAVHPDNKKKIASFSDLLDQEKDIKVFVGNPEAAFGKKTQEILSAHQDWQALKTKSTSKPTVTEVAQAVDLGVSADAGFIWDATARQYGLKIIDLPELKSEPSTIAAGVLDSAKNPAAALRFARYLAASEKGQRAFYKEHYSTVDGDPWAVRPEVVLFSGGVNRVAIKETVAEFEQREGCKVNTNYNGCGTLVATMESGENPDAFFACDASFLDKVESRFGDRTNVSETDMIMLVKKGNPKNIHSLSDLAREGMKVGMANERQTALGELTAKMLKQAGVYPKVIENLEATTPTADMLVTQFIESDKLDAVIVYRANCNFIGDKAEILSIDHPQAKASQPFAIYQKAAYPQLTARLRDAIASTKSKPRFEAKGFRWNLKAKQP